MPLSSGNLRTSEFAVRAPSALEAMRLSQGSQSLANAPMRGSRGSLGDPAESGKCAESSLPHWAIPDVRRMQQLLYAVPLNSSSPDLLSGVASAVGAEQPSISAVARTEHDFLMSSRVRIDFTSLDGRWAKASAPRLSRLETTRLLKLTSATNGPALVKKINHWVNRAISYREDAGDRSGHEDEWSNARQTLQRRFGDCEDIAILKYQMLLAMGVQNDDLFLTVAFDRVRRRDHMLVLVRTGEEFQVLDNATDELLDGSIELDYLPKISFNAEGKWLHGQRAAPTGFTELAYLSRNDVSSARLIGLMR